MNQEAPLLVAGRKSQYLKHKVRTRAQDELPAPDNGIKE